jgi:hypothetical protein
MRPAGIDKRYRRMAGPAALHGMIKKYYFSLNFINLSQSNIDFGFKKFQMNDYRPLYYPIFR